MVDSDVTYRIILVNKMHGVRKIKKICQWLNLYEESELNQLKKFSTHFNTIQFQKN